MHGYDFSKEVITFPSDDSKKPLEMHASLQMLAEVQAG